MVGQVFYLSSLESSRFERPRKCRFERALSFDTGKAAVEAAISPPVNGQEFNRVPEIARVILAARHAEVSIDPVTEFPCFVFIAIPKSDVVIQSPIRSGELEIIAWGELYRTMEDAERHVFD